MSQIERRITNLKRLQDALAIPERPVTTTPVLDEATLIAIRDGLKQIEKGTR